MADITQLEITDIAPVIGSDLGTYGVKLNTIDSLVEDKVNELILAVNTINGSGSGLATKLDKDGYIGTAQDLKDEIDSNTSSINNLNSNTEKLANKGQVNGYVPLNGSTLIDSQYLP